MISKRSIGCFVLAVLGSMAIALKDFSCIENPQDYKCKQALMVPYRFLANYDDSIIKFSGCEAKKVWFFVRHGTRYPHDAILIGLNKTLPKIQEAVVNYHNNESGPIASDLVERLKNWKFNMPEDTPYLQLAKVGMNELIGIGKRFQSRFPEIMPKTYSNDTYQFKHTGEQRTLGSAEGFATGIFGANNTQDVVYLEGGNDDPVIKMYKGCRKWIETMKENPQTRTDLEYFKNSTLVTQMLKKLTSRLRYNINFEAAKAMADTCAIEIALNEMPLSPWCQLLNSDEFEILSFASDFQIFWNDGYGYPLTYKHACSAMKAMFEFLESNDTVTTEANFVTSGTFLKMLAFLGIAEDEKPLLWNQFHQSANRSWRVGLIAPFAANFAFVSYECDTMKERSILVMHLERIVNLPGCPKNRPCPLSIMKEKYPDNDLECPFDEMCSMDPK